MFDIGFPELLLVSVVILLVFGPERLPEVLRNVGRFVGAARRQVESLRHELEREVGADEIRRELHNAQIMEEAHKLDSIVRAGRDEVEELLSKRHAELKQQGALEDDGSGEIPKFAATAAVDKGAVPDPDEGSAQVRTEPESAATEHPRCADADLDTDSRADDTSAGALNRHS